MDESVKSKLKNKKRNERRRRKRLKYREHLERLRQAMAERLNSKLLDLLAQCEKNPTKSELQGAKRCLNMALTTLENAVDESQIDEVGELIDAIDTLGRKVESGK